MIEYYAHNANMKIVIKVCLHECNVTYNVMQTRRVEGEKCLANEYYVNIHSTFTSFRILSVFWRTQRHKGDDSRRRLDYNFYRSLIIASSSRLDGVYVLARITNMNANSRSVSSSPLYRSFMNFFLNDESLSSKWRKDPCC